jgi:Mn-dependent DtxR family transcriptional regulator
MRDFSRLHRVVFALADGTKNVAKIAEILSISPDIVEKTLGDLQSMGVIAFGRQDGKDRA